MTLSYFQVPLFCIKMCDLEGDIESVGLLVDSTVQISYTGQVLGESVAEAIEKNYTSVKGVYSCVGCSILDILPFLGYRRSTLKNYLMDDNYRLLPYSEETIKEFNSLLTTISRGPGVCLVHEGDRLYGVLIDAHNKAQVLGPVTRVLPQNDAQGKNRNVLVVDADGTEQLSDTKSVNLDSCIKNGATVGVVSFDGFLLLQTFAENEAEGKEADLTLILSQGYVVLKGHHQVVWTRRQQSFLSADSEAEGTHEKFSLANCKQSQVGAKQIFVATSGLLMASKTKYSQADYLRLQQKPKMMMNLLGTHNAVLSYKAFRLCIATYDQHTFPFLPQKTLGQEEGGEENGTSSV